MTDKTDLIELTDSEEQIVSIIWQAFPEYFDGAVEGQNYGDSEKLTRLTRAISEQFIKQAGEAITENISNTFESDYIKGFDDGLRGAVQTIKELLK